MRNLKISVTYAFRDMTKGQLISEWIYKVTVSPKIWTKNCKDFNPDYFLFILNSFWNWMTFSTSVHLERKNLLDDWKCSLFSGWHRYSFACWCCMFSNIYCVVDTSVLWLTLNVRLLCENALLGWRLFGGCLLWLLLNQSIVHCKMIIGWFIRKSYVIFIYR